MSAIVFTSKFIPSTSKKFASYVDYIDREEAVRNVAFNRYSLYNEYMGNPLKSTGIFTNNSSRLTENEKNILKENFAKAQKNGSVMWQDVYSFRNEWLEKKGLYNSKTKDLDEERLKEAVRKSLDYSLEKTNMKESALWSGAIHYNTDNIHIHVAICEPNPTRKRGKRTQKTLDTMKSKFTNHLLDFEEDYKKINEMIRDNIVKSSKELNFANDVKMKILINNVIRNLPSDSRQWHYNYNTMKEANNYLDKLTEYYIKTYKPNEYKELINMLDKHEKELEEIYGIGYRRKFKDYKKNKINELYTRMGNSFLHSIKGQLKEQQKELYKKNINRYKSNKCNMIITKREIINIGNALGDYKDNIKNQSYYQRLEQGFEM